MAEKGGKKIIAIITICIILITMSMSGCVKVDDNKKGWVIGYFATYNNALNSSALINNFTENDITYNYSLNIECHRESFLIEFGNSIENNIESAIGYLTIYHIEYSTQLSLHLNKSQFPPVKEKNDVKNRRPLLENSVNYLLNIISNTTTLRPDSGFYDIYETY